jgi:hypothetical protein
VDEDISVRGLVLGYPSVNYRKAAQPRRSSKPRPARGRATSAELQSVGS